MEGQAEKAFKLAIARGNLEDVKLSVETNGQKIEINHLECAAGNGQCQVMEYLIEKTERMYNQELPLLRAFSEGKLDMVNLILGYKPNVQTVGSVCQKAKAFLDNYRNPYGYDQTPIETYRAIILKLEQYNENIINVALKNSGLE